MITFSEPYRLFLLFLPLIIRILLPKARGMHGDALKTPFLQDLQNIENMGKTTEKAKILPKNFFNIFALYFIWTLLAISAAKPIFRGDPFRPKNFGHEIVMVMDISTSMLENDYSLQGRRITRMDAVKVAAYNFLNNRINDKIGLVLFGTRAYLQAPPTFDRESVKEIVVNMQPGMAGRSTSIGDALGVAIKALDDGNNEIKKVIILLTDGENNDGSMTLSEALNLAKKQNIKIYTIGVGNENSFFNSFFSSFAGINADKEDMALKALAAETKGTYFKASDTKTLVKVYEEIDRIESNENEAKFVYQITELYYIPLLAAIISACLFLLLRRKK